MKRLVLDSSSLISFSEKCLMKVIAKLAELNDVQFLMPESVYVESVVRPLEIKRFELNAIRVQDAINDGWLRVEKNDAEIKRLTKKVLELSSGLFSTFEGPIRLIHEGEAQTIALIKKFQADALVIDERTTRMLIEAPKQLVKTMEERYLSEITVDEKRVREFRKFVGEPEIVRSVELIALAYERGCFRGELQETKKALSAALFAAKFAGCAVSFNEINAFLGGVKE
ncbi:MAG: hypothetical protein V1494_04030 [Candidatus Diapherotrites archaeon]